MDTTRGITIVGLGPGSPDQLTRAAWDWIAACDEIYLRTRHHPTVAGFPQGLKVQSFDHFYETGESFEGVYEQIIQEVLKLGMRPQGVTYAVPGHPYVAEATGPEIVRRAREQGLPVRVIEGLSFLEPTFTALQLDPYPHLYLVDALELTTRHMPAFPPESAALVAQIYSSFVAAEVKMTLLAAYPDEHPVRLVHAAGTADEVVEDLALYEIDRSPQLGLLSSLYISPLAAGTSFEALQEVVARLRAPDGCPWDREQTHLSLRKYLLEEAYETIQTLDNEDMDGLCEELGDLLLQVVLHAQIAGEEGDFNMTHILKGIHDKLIRRHPHVFSNWEVDGVGKVLQNWEKLKAAEREARGGEKIKGLLDGVPLALPALSQAQEIQDRAARVGFDWPQIDGAIDKIAEELAELKAAATDEERMAEAGDLVFAVVNVVRWYKVDAESAVRGTSLRFRRRFGYIEQAARAQGREMASLSFEEMDALWNEAKKQA